VARWESHNRFGAPASHQAIMRCGSSASRTDRLCGCTDTVHSLHSSRPCNTCACTCNVQRGDVVYSSPEWHASPCMWAHASYCTCIVMGTLSHCVSNDERQRSQALTHHLTHHLKHHRGRRRREGPYLQGAREKRRRPSRHATSSPLDRIGRQPPPSPPHRRW